MDYGAAWTGIERDVRDFLSHPVGIAILLLTFALPLVSLALVARRHWLALAPLVISAALLAAWFLYYATEWWSNPGQGIWFPAFLLIMSGWAIVAEVSVRSRRA